MTEMIQITPVGPNQSEIVANGQLLGEVHADDLPDQLVALQAAYPGQVQVHLDGNGYHQPHPVLAKALELAGLDGLLAAAKARASGTITI